MCFREAVHLSGSRTAAFALLAEAALPGEAPSAEPAGPTDVPGPPGSLLGPAEGEPGGRGSAGSGSGSGSCRASRVSPVLLRLQDDKDLVPEFVASEGLTCFIRVGAEADHNYQNYILRGEAPPTPRLRPPGDANLAVPASAQPDHAVCGRDERGDPAQPDPAVALHPHRKSGPSRPACRQSPVRAQPEPDPEPLFCAQSRLLVKTSLKLLIVFVEYSESNSPRLITAVNAVDTQRGTHTHSGRSCDLRRC